MPIFIVIVPFLPLILHNFEYIVSGANIYIIHYFYMWHNITLPWYTTVLFEFCCGSVNEFVESRVCYLPFHLEIAFSTSNLCSIHYFPSMDLLLTWGGLIFKGSNVHENCDISNIVDETNMLSWKFRHQWLSTAVPYLKRMDISASQQKPKNSCCWNFSDFFFLLDS